MAEQKNLCALIPIDLYDRVSRAKDQAGLTTAQYITNLLTEYFEMKARPAAAPPIKPLPGPEGGKTSG